MKTISKLIVVSLVSIVSTAAFAGLPYNCPEPNGASTYQYPFPQSNESTVGKSFHFARTNVNPNGGGYVIECKYIPNSVIVTSQPFNALDVGGNWLTPAEGGSSYYGCNGAPSNCQFAESNANGSGISVSNN